jgi:hypothetical protein
VGRYWDGGMWGKGRHDDKVEVGSTTIRTKVVIRGNKRCGDGDV